MTAAPPRTIASSRRPRQALAEDRPEISADHSGIVKPSTAAWPDGIRIAAYVLAMFQTTR